MIIYWMCLHLFISGAQAFLIQKSVKWQTGQTLVLHLAEGASRKDIESIIQGISFWSVTANLKFMLVTEPLFSGRSHRKVFVDKIKTPKWQHLNGFFGGRSTKGNSVNEDNDAYPAFFHVQQRTAEGQLSLETIVHEFGHTLGLSHEHDHPLFHTIFDLERLALDRLGRPCPKESVKIWGNSILCEPREVNNLTLSKYEYSQAPNANSCMNYSLNLHYYKITPPARNALRIPSLEDQEGIARAYAGNVSQEQVRSVYESYLIGAASCKGLSKLYRPGERGNPCSQQYGFKINGRQRSYCQNRVDDAFDNYYSVCTDNTSIKILGANTDIQSRLSKGHDVFLIGGGKIENSGILKDQMKN